MRRAFDVLRHGPESWVQMIGVAALTALAAISLPLCFLISSQ
jgi:hypothetical protein